MIKCSRRFGVLQYNLGDNIKNEFIEKIKFINYRYLLENLGQGGHNIALQRLKDKFGGKKGMSSKNKKEADKIIRESLRGNPMQMHPNTQQFQHFAPMPPMNMPFPLGPYQVPQQPFGQQQFGDPVRGINGPCFACQQHGHVARNCPNTHAYSRGGGNSRRGNFSGRGNPNRKFFGKKKN